MSDDPVLTGVAPEQRQRVTQRVHAIRAFIEKPGRAEAMRDAAELGMGTTQFYKLVKTWRAHGSPERVSPHSRLRTEDAQGDLLRTVLESASEGEPNAVARTARTWATQTKIEVAGPEVTRRGSSATAGHFLR